MVSDYLIAHFKFFFVYRFWRVTGWFSAWIHSILAWKLGWWSYIPWRRFRNRVWLKWLILMLWRSWSYLVDWLLDGICCRIDGFHSLHHVLIRVSWLVCSCCQIRERASVSSLVNTRVCPSHGGRLRPAESQWMLRSYLVIIILIIWIEFRICYFVKQLLRLLIIECYRSRIVPVVSCVYDGSLPWWWWSFNIHTTLARWRLLILNLALTLGRRLILPWSVSCFVKFCFLCF